MNNFAKRRRDLSLKLYENSALVLFSGPLVKESADGFYPFTVNKNFYYLTGIDQHESVLLITKINGELTEHLFILPFDPLKEKWDGKVLTAKEAKTISGIAHVDINEKLGEKLLKISKKVNTVFYDFEQGLLATGLKPPAVFVREQFANHEFVDVYEHIIKMRMVKDAGEVLLIEQSIALTHKALISAQKAIKSGAYEYEVAAKFLYEVKRQNGKLGFGTIVASGKNATILHYPTLGDKIRKNDLVLLDLGAHNNMYTADISRTYPAGSEISNEAKLIYETVLLCNKAVIEYIKPGLTLLDLQNYTRDFLKAQLVAINLLTESDDINKVYYHGVSHHLGLDTHDPSIRTLPLEPGNVITVEPGLYFAKYGVGVRIEDNILVTKTGSKNLSHMIAKEMKDIF